MKRRKWWLPVLLLAIIVGYWKFFYKTWTEKNVPESADSIITIDVKRVTNTIIWNAITTPSQWSIGSFFSKKKKGVDWKKMVNVPDYISFFHIKGQPLKVWHVWLEVNDEEAFRDGLQQLGFLKTGQQQYVNINSGIAVMRNGDHLLVTTGALNNYECQLKAAFELNNQKFISKERFSKLVDAKSHAALEISDSSFFRETVLIKINLNDHQLKIDGNIAPKNTSGLISREINIDDAALWSAAFADLSGVLVPKMKDSTKLKISNAINMDVDSFFRNGNHFYQFQLKNILSRTDSAITYDYDENFNQIQKVTLNNVREPLLRFSIAGDSTQPVFDYLKRNEKLEEKNGQYFFIALPLGKTIASEDTKSMTISSENFAEGKTSRTIDAIFFQRIFFEKIPEDLWKYIPDNIRKPLLNMSFMEMDIVRKDDQLHVKAIFEKKKNEVPIWKF